MKNSNLGVSFILRNAPNVDEETPLMAPVLRGAVESAAVLIEYGADLSRKNAQGSCNLLYISAGYRACLNQML